MKSARQIVAWATAVLWNGLQSTRDMLSITHLHLPDMTVMRLTVIRILCDHIVDSFLRCAQVLVLVCVQDDGSELVLAAEPASQNLGTTV